VADVVVRLAEVSYRYPEAGSRALREVDLEIEAGEFVVLAGRSGSGKTTLLGACCGLVPHYHGGELSGGIEIAGLDVAEHGPSDLGGIVGLVSQDPETQVVASTVRGEIELPLEMRGEPATRRARAVEEVALALAIPHLLDRAADSLSGGELQRVALAAALVGRPRLVLLDEPTSQLDPVAGDELIWLLRRLNEQWATAVVLAEHRLERCLAAADRVVAMAGGAIAFDGRPERFLDWSLAEDEALATPAARLFGLAGLRPLPSGVKRAREQLAEHGLAPPEPPPLRREPEPERRRSGRLSLSALRRGRRAPQALSASEVWVELDDGEALREVLRGISLRLEPGERVALMGRNGAGKSTLMRTAAGILNPVRGRIETPGGCALLAQSPADFLVRERVSEELPGEAGRAALAAVDLEWALDADPRDLSGGERERLALAIVMAGRGASGEPPGLICLDEPTRGMDRARKEELSSWLGQLAAAGSCLLVATHDVEFAATFARRAVLLGDGRVIADGPIEEVLSGGWYFATEVARILGVEGTISPEEGAALLHLAEAGREAGSGVCASPPRNAPSPAGSEGEAEHSPGVGQARSRRSDYEDVGGVK
jgi:energy-coupling factor transport system ATP-binding protein